MKTSFFFWFHPLIQAELCATDRLLIAAKKNHKFNAKELATKIERKKLGKKCKANEFDLI